MSRGHLLLAYSSVKIPAVSVSDSTHSPLVDLKVLSILPTGPAPCVSSFAVNDK